MGIAVAGIRGVAGLGGRTRACGWDWGYGSHGSRILELDGQFIVTLRFPRGIITATFTISADFPLDADLGPPCPSNQDS